MPNRYYHSHVDPSGPGDSRPTALQIISDEHLDSALPDKTILITGCSSGIGVETARALAATGATLYLTARDLSRARKSLADILSSDRIHLLHMDNTSLASVHAGATEFLAHSASSTSSSSSSSPTATTPTPKLHILILNAGVMACPYALTPDGFETQFQTNHLAHFFLFSLLRRALANASTPDFHSRVVVVSSGAHRRAGVPFGNYDYDGGKSYDPRMAYAASKTANVLMANGVERRYGVGSDRSASGWIHGLSISPGAIRTPMQRYYPQEALDKRLAEPEMHRVLKSVEQGAATTVYAAVGREWEGRGGLYLGDCAEVRELREGEEEHAGGLKEGWSRHIFDEEGERRLWVDSCQMVGVEDK
ncbi:hypothetical protein MMC20_004230 [Loxospora ochrophaea]|nr:hypothetical protein [Loxospora ochrophaea]